MKLLGFINHTYKVDSIKNMTRQKRGTSSLITGFEQNMSQVNNRQELLNGSEYKDQLIEMTKQYVLKFGSGILPRSPPFVINSREK